MRALRIVGWSLIVGGLAWTSYVAVVAYDLYDLMGMFGGELVAPTNLGLLGSAAHLTPIAIGVLALMLARKWRS
jgi:hypothetical protein